MKSLDHSLKYLIEQTPEDFIRFGAGNPSIQVVGPLPVALPARGRDVDAGYQATVDGIAAVVHVEFHRRHQSLLELAIDVAEAQIRFFRRERLPVLSHVWDLYGSVDDPLLEDHTLKFGLQTGTSSVYRRINLKAIRARTLLEQAPPSLWPLVPLTRDGASVKIVGLAYEAIEARSEASSSIRADHMAVLWFMADAEGVPLSALKAFFSTERLMESALYRDIYQSGEQAGELRGDAKRQAETIVRILALRTGTVDPAVRERVYVQTIVELLDVWYNEALRITTAEQAELLADRIRRAPAPVSSAK